MWLLDLFVYAWLTGAVCLPCIALVYSAGTKWKRLHFLTGSRKRWLLIWGSLGLLEALVIAGLLWATHFPEVVPVPGWAGRAAFSALNTVHAYNVFADFVLGFIFRAIGEIAIGVTFAALVWWIFSVHRKTAERPRARYAIALLASACVLGIANRIVALRPPTCDDCFVPHGVPFTYLYEGGFVSREVFVWSGAVGNTVLIVSIGVIAGWIWNRLSRNHPLKTAKS